MRAADQIAKGEPAAVGEHFTLAGLPRLVQQRRTQSLWVDAAGEFTWEDLGSQLAQVRQRCAAAGVQPGDVVLVPGEATLSAVAWMLGVAALGATIAPLRLERWAESERWKQLFAIAWQVRDGALERVGAGENPEAAAKLFAELRVKGNPGLILSTGGTSGEPKVVLHDLAGLLAVMPVRIKLPQRRILPLMRFDHIGGLDMLWRALAGGQVIVAPPPDFSPESIAATVDRFRVEVLPATPSFLNLLLLSGVVRTHDLSSLCVVPYGAEPMSPALLERLQSAFPQVEFVQRFGTSETGTLPVYGAGDGLRLSGKYPAFQWKIVEGELWVLTPTRALGYLSGNPRGFTRDGWFRTGDLAEINEEGGLTIRGRRNEVINVGGEKVLPAEVEEILITHPQVADCRVFAQANRILGQVVAAEIIWLGPERDPVLVKDVLQKFAAPRLSRAKLPVRVRLVREIAATINLKKFRGPR